MRFRVVEHGERKVARLPKRLQEWPPANGIEARIAECLKCGFLPDEGQGERPGDEGFDAEYEYTICPHLRWDGEFSEWVPK